jgi:hypothetical protein
MRVSVYRESRAAGLMADVGLRSKQGRGREGLYSGPYDPSELGDKMVSLRAKVLSPRGKRGGDWLSPLIL